MIWNIHPHQLRGMELAGCMPYHDSHSPMTWDELYQWVEAEIQDYEHAGKGVTFS